MAITKKEYEAAALLLALTKGLPEAFQALASRLRDNDNEADAILAAKLDIWARELRKREG